MAVYKVPLRDVAGLKPRGVLVYSVCRVVRATRPPATKKWFDGAHELLTTS